MLSVCILTDPTYGGVTASFATLGDVVIAERGAQIGFAGPRVIQQTIRQELPAGFQTAEFLLAHGLVDRVEPRPRAARRCCERLLALHDAPDRRSPDERRPSPRGQRWHRADPRPPAQLDACDADPGPWCSSPATSSRPTTLDYLGTRVRRLRRAARRPRLRRRRRPSSAGWPAIGGRRRRGDRPPEGAHHRELRRPQLRHAAPGGLPQGAAADGPTPRRFGCRSSRLVDTPGAYPGPGGRGARAVARDRRGIMRSMPGCRCRSSRWSPARAAAAARSRWATADRVLMLENAYLLGDQPGGLRGDPLADPRPAPEPRPAPLRLDAPHLLRHRRRRRRRPGARRRRPQRDLGRRGALRLALLRRARRALEGLPTRARCWTRRYERFPRIGGWRRATRSSPQGQVTKRMSEDDTRADGACTALSRELAGLARLARAQSGELRRCRADGPQRRGRVGLRGIAGDPAAPPTAEPWPPRARGRRPHSPGSAAAPTTLISPSARRSSAPSTSAGSPAPTVRRGRRRRSSPARRSRSSRR